MGLKVIALVSGGKDSCFALMECVRMGHEIVGLVNLLPADSDIDDTNSWMYQTAGHGVIEAYARCMQLPLLRRRIQGAAANTQLAYATTDGDEVEDLTVALAHAKRRFPEATAVCSGAIASDYQRTRVESVAIRLGLTPLAPLWRRAQLSLLPAMLEAHVHAILIKVAAIGLVPSRHLGMSLQEAEEELLRLRAKYGNNVCGEGGEYETLVLDSPLFTGGRIAVGDSAGEVVLPDPDPYAPVGLLKLTKWSVEAKDTDSAHNQDAVVEEITDDMGAAAVQEILGSASEVSSPRNAGAFDVRPWAAQGGGFVRAGCAVEGGRGAESAAAAVEFALRAAISEATELAGCGIERAAFVQMTLRDMATFAAANGAYCQQMPQTLPPSRACVATGAGTPIASVEILLPLDGGRDRRQLPRRVLHVQSVSPWAPACIGPYSQATALGPLIHIAGQIPLDPASMEVCTRLPGDAGQATPAWAAHIAQHAGLERDAAGPLLAELERALVSTQAVAVAAGGDVSSGLLSATCWCSPDAAIGRRSPGARRTACEMAVASLLDGSLMATSRYSPLSAATEYGGGALSDATDSGSEEADFGFGWDPSRDARKGGQGASAAGERRPGEVAAQAPEPMSQSARGALVRELGLEGDLGEFWTPQKAASWRRGWKPLLVWCEVPQLPRGCAFEIQPVLAEPAFQGHVPSESTRSSSDEGAREQTGCCPAWLRDARRGDAVEEAGAGAVAMQCLVSRGRFARAHVGVRFREGQGADADAASLGATAARMVASAAAEAGLSLPASIALLRTTRAVSSPGCEANAMRELCEAFAKPLGTALPPPIAATAVGHDPSMLDDVMIEVLMFHPEMTATS
ncbi:unnamed protein product [Pedinophyceae sp. YPF-701]|nr:unnamed protein product [Pedinophyceae sp. YPF-701]